MADQDQDQDDKQHDPTERKLAQAREEGDVVRSEDLQVAASYLGLLLGLFLAGGWAINTMGRAGMSLLAQPDRLLGLGQGNAGGPLGLVTEMIWPAFLLLAFPAALVLLLLLSTRTLIFAPSKLEFKASRLSVLGNAKQKFGRAGLAEFLKRAAKMVVIAVLLGIVLSNQVDEVLMSARMEARPVTKLVAEQVIFFLQLLLATALVFGVLDYLWQRAEFQRRHRMSRQELVDEMKESEGDPHMKADRRRRAQEIATNRMLADVPKADVVIVNPTHYAVALKWSRKKGAVPRCVAKGTDEVAHRIREMAQEHGVPIRSDPPTARALFAAVEIGKEIRVEHFAPVAAAIRFADEMRRKARRK